MWRRLLLVVVVALAWVAVKPVAHVAACSCAATTLPASIAAGDVAFVGRATQQAGPDAEGMYVWTFEVRDVVKGDLPAEIEVLGSDWGGACGIDFSQFTEPILLAVREQDGEYVDPGCSPVGTADDLLTALAPLEAPDGNGPVAALVANRHRWSNLAALDAQGRVLSWGDIGGSVAAIAGCPGTDRAVAEVWTADGGLELVLIDLTTMTRVDVGPADVPSTTLLCVPGGDVDAPRIVGASGGLDNDGAATITTREGPTGAVDAEPLDVADVVVSPAGDLFTIPITAGGSLERRGPDLAVAGGVAFAPDDVGVDAALDPDGTRLAVLVTDRVTRATYDTAGTAVVLYDVTGTDPVEVGRFVFGEPGNRTGLMWLDAGHLVVERTGSNAVSLDIVGLDGATVAAVDRPLGNGLYGAATVGGAIVRSTNGGFERIDVAGTITSLTPAPRPESEGYVGGQAVISAVSDGATIPALTPPPPEIHPPTAAVAPPDSTTPDTAPVETPLGPPETASSSTPPTDPTVPATTLPPTTAAQTVPGDDGSDFPIVPIAALLAVAVLAGGFAVVRARAPR